jgi:hypothetical protein
MKLRDSSRDIFYKKVPLEKIFAYESAIILIPLFEPP